ncbi:MAG: hypothetical protein WKF87_08720 [Chryseolinea sp.]
MLREQPAHNSNTGSSREKMLFENILHDFRIDSNSVQSIKRSLNDYYFDLMETFNLDSLLIAKVLNNTETVIVFDALTKAGQKMDIVYHDKIVRQIDKLSTETIKWRTAFLDVSNLRDKLYRDMIQDTSKVKTTRVDAPIDNVDIQFIEQIDAALLIATRSLIDNYADNNVAM